MLLLTSLGSYTNKTGRLKCSTGLAGGSVDVSLSRHISGVIQI